MSAEYTRGSREIDKFEDFRLEEQRKGARKNRSGRTRPFLLDPRSLEEKRREVESDSNRCRDANITKGGRERDQAKGNTKEEGEKWEAREERGTRK